MAVTKSFNVEFDDALLDLEGWKASRYEGSKLKARYINEFNKGPKNTSSIFLGSNPNLSIPSSANTFKLYAPGAPAIGTFSAAEKPLIKGQFKNSNPAQTELVHDKMDLSGQGLANTEVWGGDILGPKRSSETTWHGAHPTDPSKKGNGWYTRTIGGKKLTKTIAGIPS